MGTHRTAGKVTDYEVNTGIVEQRAILSHYIFKILPAVKRTLGYWKCEAGFCVNNELKRQALLSIQDKAFHCYGGAVFAVSSREKQETLLRLITAYQTLCDYLDNLCDRSGFTDGKAFEMLHRSIYHSLVKNAEYEDYYKYYPHKNDGDYIQKLVKECQSCINELPSWKKVEQEAMKLARLYSGLQINKHLLHDIREDMLKNWVKREQSTCHYILWQEFAAATGSTLAIFALMGLASRNHIEKEEIDNTVNAYFPWICGLHILLDYFIDRQEDKMGGDLNFTFYYEGEQEMLERLKLFVRQSHRAASLIEDQSFTGTVVEGLLAMYLSDKKVKEQGFDLYARELLAESGKQANRTYHLCKVVRKMF